jgi:hypothetical protein
MVKIQKPKRPTKYIWQNNYRTFDFNYVSKKVSLDYFIEWCKKEVPKNAKDVTLELNEYWEYDDCIVSLNITWKEKVLNTRYTSEISKYNKKMLKFKV